MDLIFDPDLTVCGIDELPAQSRREVTHVLSIIDPDRPEIVAFEEYGEHFRTTLRFHDIIRPSAGQIMPSQEHLEAILDFGQAFQNERGNARGHVLVHCHMGVSRSTAAMLILIAQGNPALSPAELFQRLTAIRPQAWPNSKIIELADAKLGHNGELVRELTRHYGRQLEARPEYREWMTSLGRKDEVDMAYVD